MIAPDQGLDTLGLYCPIPVILTAKKIKEMQAGQVLEVLSDDEGIKQDMPIWCKNSGHVLLEVIEEGEVVKLYVRKSA